MWNYVYFLIHLQMKNKSDMNGVESSIKEKNDRGETSWFPLLRCLRMDKKQNVGHDSGTNELEDMMEEINTKFHRTEEAIQKLEQILS